MKIEFSMESPLWRFFEFLADIFAVNVLFVLTSIPIVTIGASISAMDAVFFEKRENKLVSIRSTYFRAFKDNFVRSTILWLLYVAFVAMCILDVNVAINLNGSIRPVFMAALGAILFVITMILIYSLAMNARFVNSFADTLIKSMMIAVLSFPYTLTIFLLIVVAIGLTISSYSAILISFSIWITIGFGLIGYISAICLLRAFRRFTFKSDLPEDSAEEEMYRALEEDKKYKEYKKEQKNKR